MVGSRRQAYPVYAAMMAMTIIGIAVALPAEQHGSQVLRDSGVNITAGDDSSGGNMSDKEVRYGIASTVNWAVTTTNASNGSVNGGHDALRHGRRVPIANMFTGEVIWGGVGSGLYGMFFYIVMAVFIAGLMVGRTPEYLGKKIEAKEIKLAAVGALLVPTMVLILTAISVVTDRGLASMYNPAAHGFSEALYAYDSQSNNNGSAFAGYGATEFSTLVARSHLAALRAAIAHSPSAARWLRRGPCAIGGHVRTDGATFAVLLVGVVILTAGLCSSPRSRWADVRHFEP
jgi:K+-transporting ATPase ATPase A chain